MLNFDLSIPTTIHFGKGKIDKLADAVQQRGTRILLTYGGKSIKENGLYASVTDILKKHAIPFIELSGIKPNPSITSVREGVRLCKEHDLDFILAVGGGSVIDASKAIAAGACYDGDPWDFCMRKALVKKALKIGTILTLAATGSEMNGGAVISNEETLEKRGMGSPILRPAFSILDPEYTCTVPPHQTAAGTADIMSHVFEQYFSPTPHTFVQDRLAEALLLTCIEYGPIAYKYPNHYEARAQLMWASTLALNGILSAGKMGDWSTHMIEHEVSAVYDITHGTGLAIITPAWMEHVLSADTLPKFTTYARNVWNIHESDDTTAAKKAIAATRDFFTSLGIPSRLRDVGVENTRFGEMADKAMAFGDLGNFKKLTRNNIITILENSY